MKNELYIRFKDIPDNETSCVYDGDLGKIREESDVCCYNCVEVDDVYKIILPSFSTGPLYDLSSFIYQHESGKIPCYLITGDKVGTGTYNEPTLKNIKIVGILYQNELHSPIPKYKLDKSNIQLILK